MTKFERAKAVRDLKLKRTTEIYAACACEFPLIQYRNGHGHGTTADAQECPAIAVIATHDEEDIIRHHASGSRT